jgi:hypothetical protein
MGKVAHLLGNGPSRNEFQDNPPGDLFGCNLSDFGIPLKATFIMDKVVIDHIHNNKVELPFPIVCPEALVKLVRSCPTTPMLYDTVKTNLTNGESTGHKAFLYLVANGYTQVHFWGFDSVFGDVIASDSHHKIPQGVFTEKNLPRWRKLWDQILNLPNVKNKVKVTIHRPGSSRE